MNRAVAWLVRRRERREIEVDDLDAAADREVVAPPSLEVIQPPTAIDAVVEIVAVKMIVEDAAIDVLERAGQGHRVAILVYRLRLAGVETGADVDRDSRLGLAEIEGVDAA